MSRKLFETEDAGFIKVSIELNTNALKKLTKYWEKDYGLFVTL